MKQFLTEILQNPDGSYSSRRAFGIALICAAVVGWYMGKDGNLAIIVAGYGAILLGITTKDKQAAVA